MPRQIVDTVAVVLVVIGLALGLVLAERSSAPLAGSRLHGTSTSARP